MSNYFERKKNIYIYLDDDDCDKSYIVLLLVIVGVLVGLTVAIGVVVVRRWVLVVEQ